MQIKTTLNQVAQLLPSLFKAKIVPFLHSSPAIGKSSIAKQIADKYQLKVIDLRLTELDSSDLNGLPYFENGKSTFLPFDTFPLTDTPIPKGYKGWLLLLDEFNSALPSVQASAYKLILDRQVGQHKLHDKVAIIACGNLDTDNAIVNTMSSALISRFAHFYIELNFEEWQEWAVQNDISPLITGFLSFKPDCLYTFNPDSHLPYASPRTWQMVNKLMPNISLPLVASLLGSAVAYEFMAYLDSHLEVPNILDILNDPSNYPIPNKLGIQWATLTMTVSHLEKDIDGCIYYLNRFSPELQVVALREIKGRYPKLLDNATVRSWIISLSRSVYE